LTRKPLGTVDATISPTTLLAQAEGLAIPVVLAVCDNCGTAFPPGFFFENARRAD
jgi:hypothetical protein